VSIKLNIQNAGLRDHELEYVRPLVETASMLLSERIGQGHEMLGWLDFPRTYDKEEFARIKAAAKRIQSQSQVLVSIGIGGSYLGARAGLEFVKGPFGNQLRQGDGVEVYFAGNNLSSSYIQDLLDIIGEQDFSVNVISKSGTTTEPAAAFRIFKAKLEERYGKDGARERIYATTDKARGALRGLAEAEGYETFVVPDNIGGRFSCLSAVGLLPMAAGGMDIDQVTEGCLDACERYKNLEFLENDAMLYAALRFLMLMKGKKVEMRSVRAAIDNNLAYVSEDRKTYGLVLIDSITFNMSLAALRRFFSERGVVDERKEAVKAEEYRRLINVKTATMEQPVGSLSGGNQQKVVLAKWMLTQPDVLILDEPTRGIDAAARGDVYSIIHQLREQGVSVLLISSDMEEMVELADRVVIMYQGRVNAEFQKEDINQDNLTAAAFGILEKEGA